LINASITGNNADSVFPVAVGAINNTFFPAIIGGIALIWGSVGTAKPFSRMALWTGVENEENTVVGGISVFCDTFILLFVISKR
jgi:hypothetical protein